MNLWAISAKEKDPPEGKEALHWNLFTDVETETFEDACERIDWYAQRFKIEVFHRILKSGCRVEDRRLESYESLKRCLAIDMVIAWRIYYLTMLGRETPDIGCDFFFDKSEQAVLRQYERKCLKKEEIAETLTLGKAIKIVAYLGGFVTGKDRVPGTEVMWRGLTRLGDIALGWSLNMPEVKGLPKCRSS